MSIERFGWLVVAVAFIALDARAAIIAPGYSVTEIATPDVATGGVTAIGGAVFVGVGAFGGKAQSVVRIDGGGTTVLADGFNALSGMVYDSVGDRLLVGDNADEAPGADTGDTIYSIASPFALAPSVQGAKDIEILPSGTFPGMFDLILDPNDPTGTSLFVSDSSEAFPPDGRVVRVDTSTLFVEELQLGLDFVSGLAARSDQLFVGQLEASAFTGEILAVDLPDGSGTLTPLLTGMAGLNDLALDGDGNLLATSASFTPFVSSILRIDSDNGDVLETVASGLDFATALDEEDGLIYVLEGSPTKSRILVLTPIPEPGTAVGVAIGLLVLAARRRAEFH